MRDRSPSPARLRSPDSRRAAGACTLLAVAGLAALVTATQAPAASAGEQGLIADLPFVEVPYSPFVHVEISRPGEPPIHGVIDTGINVSVASQRALREFGGRRIGSGREAVHARKTLLGRELRVRKAREGPKRAPPTPWVHIGAEFLSGFVVQIDLPARRVRFFDPGKRPPEVAAEADSATHAVLPLFAAGFRPLVAVEVNDVPVTVVFDTMAPAPLWIGTRPLIDAGVHPGPLPILRERRGRESRLRLFETDRVRLGPLAFGVVPVLVGQTNTRDELGPMGSSVGLDLLSGFVVTLDIGRKTLAFERTAEREHLFGGQPWGYTRASGAFLAPFGERWQVIGVLPASPADRAGLRPGDLLDRRVLGVERPSQVQEALREGRPIVVGREIDGRWHDVVLPEPGEAGGGNDDEPLP